ncbi:MAG TPA: efflux RND transporter periplasmic adaptor subunit [Acidobacteria bacterium]|nr:efflux RND transporter periplasmic adaptor subunit [Acidobacteriota bacterium]
MRSRTLLTIIFFVLLAAGLFAVRAHRVHQKNTAPLIEAMATAVRVVRVGSGEVQTTHHYLGQVLGRTEVTLAPRITGRILEVTVREGDRVQAGQTLVRLDSREIDDAVARAEARLASARVALEAARVALETQQDATARDEVLFEAEAISREQRDRSRAASQAAKARFAASQAQLTAAKSTLDSARTRLAYAHLEAPVEGRVAARLADPGDLATPGRAVLRIVPVEAVRVRCRAPAEDLSALEVGRDARLAVGDRTLNARISRTFPAMGREHLATFEIDLADPPAELVPGATVGVDVVVSSASGSTVPTDSLLEGERGSFVFTTEGRTAHLVKVEPLARSEQRVAVAGPPNPGEWVIVARPSRLMLLAEGSPIRVVEQEESRQ